MNTKKQDWQEILSVVVLVSLAVAAAGSLGTKTSIADFKKHEDQQKSQFGEIDSKLDSLMLKVDRVGLKLDAHMRYSND